MEENKMVRNKLAPAAVIWVLLTYSSSRTLAVEVTLPVGSAPTALVSAHFPNRMYEFVWRNWNAVEPGKLAEVLGTTVANVESLASSMGLPVASVPPEMKARGYITLIRRNWHLLPYDQLLMLLEMTPERLDFVLREDDMLWYKLGLLKPQCEPLRYQTPNEAARRRAAEIRRVVEEEFGEWASGREAEPRFAFLRQLHNPTRTLTSQEREQVRTAGLRLVYSYAAVYGDPLLNPQLNPYPEGLLEGLAAVGVNGVWVQAVLRDLAPGGATFPEFGVDHEKRLANLRALVARAGKYGIGVYLYLNEPRAMPGFVF
jgi:hypothetical protein